MSGLRPGDLMPSACLQSLYFADAPYLNRAGWGKAAESAGQSSEFPGTFSTKVWPAKVKLTKRLGGPELSRKEPWKVTSDYPIGISCLLGYSRVEPLESAQKCWGSEIRYITTLIRSHAASVLLDVEYE